MAAEAPSVLTSELTAIRDIDGLLRAGLATPEDRPALEAVGARYAIGIPPAMRR